MKAPGCNPAAAGYLLKQRQQSILLVKFNYDIVIAQY